MGDDETGHASEELMDDSGDEMSLVPERNVFCSKTSVGSRREKVLAARKEERWMRQG